MVDDADAQFVLQCLSISNMLPSHMAMCSEHLADTSREDPIPLARVMKVVTAMRAVFLASREYRQGNVCLYHVSFYKHLQNW